MLLTLNLDIYFITTLYLICYKGVSHLSLWLSACTNADMWLQLMFEFLQHGAEPADRPPDLCRTIIPLRLYKTGYQTESQL